jgi:dipeptidyl-peptidase-3
LNIAAYKGFVEPRVIAVEENGEIVDVKIEHPEDYVERMLELEENYSFLPLEN